MKSYAFCPISEKKIDERVARSNAAITVLLLILAAITQNLLPVLFLGVDFFMRSIDQSQYSLISIISRRIVKFFSVKAVYINAGPKLFAARIGLILSALIVILSLINAQILAYILISILGLFSFLEFAFGLCVACEIYPFLYRIFYKLSFQN